MWASTSRGPQEASGSVPKCSARGHGPPASTRGRSAAKAARDAARRDDGIGHRQGLVGHARSLARPAPLDRPVARGQSGGNVHPGLEPRLAARRLHTRSSHDRYPARPAGAGLVGTPAANQSGAHLNKDAFAEAKDFLPLDGIDHVEFWVGNARQASAYFRALWGFTPVAFSGLETGVRDRASYVMQQHDIRIVLTAPLTPDGEIAEHVRAHGDGVRDIAFAVQDVGGVLRETTTRGARSAHGAGGARRRRGRRPPAQRRLDLRRRPPLLHRPPRLPRRVRARLSQGQEARAAATG